MIVRCYYSSVRFLFSPPSVNEHNCFFVHKAELVREREQTTMISLGNKNYCNLMRMPQRCTMFLFFRHGPMACHGMPRIFSCNVLWRPMSCHGTFYEKNREKGKKRLINSMKWLSRSNGGFHAITWNPTSHVMFCGKPWHPVA